MGQPLKVHQQLREILVNYAPVMEAWISEDNVMDSTFETSYGENYSPCTAAVVFADVYRITGDEQHLELALRMIRRSGVLFKDMKTAPFTRVFLHHFAMLALLYLPKDVREKYRGEFQSDFVDYVPDDCGTINLNCAALQWGSELYLEALGYREARDPMMIKMEELILARQREGFLNDAFDFGDQETFAERDGMPIAYTLFTLSIVTGILTTSGDWKLERQSHKQAMEVILGRGRDWLEHALAFDGTLAMAERSRQQVFTWGSLSAVFAYCGVPQQGLYERIVASWMDYKHEDGTYSVTPNFLPHAIRCGYEWYSHVNCYGNLGLVGLAIAERIYDNGLEATLLEEGRTIPAHNQYLDTTSGYGFMRKQDSFFAVSLRMHEGQFTPAMCGFHYRLGDAKLPLAEPKFNIDRMTAEIYKQTYALGTWEGFALHTKQGEVYVPNTKMNAHTRVLDDGLEMELDTEDWHCQKKIRMSPDGFTWEYRLQVKRDYAICEQIMPLLMHDGRNELRLHRHDGHRYTFSFAGNTFEMRCNNEQRGHFPQDSTYSPHNQLSVERSFHSVSGVSAPLSFKIADNLRAGDTVSWEIVLTKKVE